MKAYKIISFFLTLNLSILNWNTICLQNVCGAEIEKEYYFANQQKLVVEVQVCREGNSVGTVSFDWGDGEVEDFALIGSYNAGNGYVIDYYRGNHIYAAGTNEYVELVLRAGQLTDDFVNVNTEENNAFVLRDSVLIFSEDLSPLVGYAYNEGPYMEILSPSYYEAEGWYESFIMAQAPFDMDSLSYSLTDFPADGYSFPANNEELFMYSNVMYWDRPFLPGKYAVAVKLREVRWTTNPFYNQQWTMLSTITKAFTIIVDSASLVTTVPKIGIENIMSVYPNPTTTTTTLEYGGLDGEIHLKAINAQGQVMLQKTLDSTAQIQRETIDVSTWPAGVYWIELSNEAGQVTKKLVVE